MQTENSSNLDIQVISDKLKSFTPQIEGRSFLVSGGAGFLGSWFCEVALSLGGSVICIDNLISGSKKNISHLSDNPKFSFREEDIAEAEIPPGIDYIVHMASIASPPLYQEKPVETLDSAILGSINLLRYSKDHLILGYLLASTSEVYGNPPPSEVPTSESYAGNTYSYGPRSMYDESKRVEEAYCYAYFKKYDVPVRIARIFNTYGPRIDSDLPIEQSRALIKFIDQALHNEPITIYGNGETTRSFCYVTDQITGLFQLLLTEGLDGEVINIGNDSEISLGQLASTIVEITGSNSEIVQQSTPAYNLENDPQRRQPNLEKAKKLISYNPEVTLQEGITKTITWFKTK